jgi:predicted kinase
MKFRDLFNQDTWLPDWDKIFSIKEFKDMETCEQSKIWHKEKFCSTHTKLVTQALQSFLLNRENIEPSDNEYYIMMMSAAICHDLGKPSTTKFDEEKGDYTTKCHGLVGAKITRRLFFDEEFTLREKVCYMVRHHMDLHHIFDKEEMSTRKMIQLSHGRVRVKDMLILNICDSLGSKNDEEDEEFIAEKEERIKSLAEGLNCYETPYEFNNDYEKIRFFHFKDRLFPEGYALPKDYGQFTMYVMIGVPGSGKSYYIEKYLKDAVQISRDLIRTEIGIKGEKPQGNKEQESHVTEIFNERMLECCKNKQDFVIDNTNVRKMYRDAYTDMTLRFMPRIVYVYIEAPDLQTYKDRRKGMMPLEVIDRMWSQFDFPEPTEYNEMILDKQFKH